jgi:DNA-directed RNA polymerase specialized sigma24 family protein
MYRAAYTVTGSQPNAEDPLQNVFLKLLEPDFQLKLKANPRSYLYRAAVNISLKTVRSRKRRRLLDLVDGVEHIEAPAGVSNHPLSASEARPRSRIVNTGQSSGVNSPATFAELARSSGFPMDP